MRARRLRPWTPGRRGLAALPDAAIAEPEGRPDAAPNTSLVAVEEEGGQNEDGRLSPATTHDSGESDSDDDVRVRAVDLPLRRLHQRFQK